MEISEERLDLKLIHEIVNDVKITIENPLITERDLDKELRKIRDEAVNRLSSMVSNYREKIELAKKLLEEVLNALSSIGYITGYLDAELVSEGVIGIAQNGIIKEVLNVGLTIDKVLGLPYYPGSSIKGMISSFIENEFQQLTEIEGGNGVEYGENALNSCTNHLSELKTTFSEDSVSKVMFLDSYPIGCSRTSDCAVFKPAIMTPHYFKGGEVVDTELEVTPVPIRFLTISPGLVFRFGVAVRKDDKDLLKCILWLLLNLLGVGGFARGSKGFNQFEIAKDIVLPSKVRAIRIG